MKIYLPATKEKKKHSLSALYTSYTTPSFSHLILPLEQTNLWEGIISPKWEMKEYIIVIRGQITEPSYLV